MKTRSYARNFSLQASQNLAIHCSMMSDSKNSTHSYEDDLRPESISTYILSLYHRPRTSILVAEKNLMVSSKVTMTSGSKRSLSMDHVRSRTTHMDSSGPTSQRYNGGNSISNPPRSLTTAREEIYFPFLTSEVKCGKQGLDLADRPNTHSMTIALRGIVDIYRKANRSSEVHRRALGFSISHDDNSARICAHYPEINGDNTTYWCDRIKELNFGDEKGKERWKCYQFTLNVCQYFALPLLERLKTVIDQLPDPDSQRLEPSTSFDDVSFLSSQDDTSAPESQDESLRKPRRAGGLNPELRTMIQSLQRQLEQQRQDSMAQLEQQKQESEQQREIVNGTIGTTT